MRTAARPAGWNQTTEKILVSCPGAEILTSIPPAPTVSFCKQTEVLTLHALQQFKRFSGRKTESRYPCHKPGATSISMNKYFMTFRNDVCSKARFAEVEEQREWRWRCSGMRQPEPTSGLDSLSIHTSRLCLTIMSS